MLFTYACFTMVKEPALSVEGTDSICHSGHDTKLLELSLFWAAETRKQELIAKYKELKVAVSPFFNAGIAFCSQILDYANQFLITSCRQVGSLRLFLQRGGERMLPKITDTCLTDDQVLLEQPMLRRPEVYTNARRWHIRCSSSHMNACGIISFLALFGWGQFIKLVDL